MADNLAKTSWKEIDGRNDVLTLADNSLVWVEAPLTRQLFSICWNSNRFTLTVTKIDPAQQPAIRKNNKCLDLKTWKYFQVDTDRPNYRILFAFGYDKELDVLTPQVMKDAKLRFPGIEGDVHLNFL